MRMHGTPRSCVTFKASSHDDPTGNGNGAAKSAPRKRVTPRNLWIGAEMLRCTSLYRCQTERAPISHEEGIACARRRRTAVILVHGPGFGFTPSVAGGRWAVGHETNRRFHLYVRETMDYSPQDLLARTALSMTQRTRRMSSSGRRR
jgi:hypothetical protein